MKTIPIKLLTAAILSATLSACTLVPSHYVAAKIAVQSSCSSSYRPKAIAAVCTMGNLSGCLEDSAKMQDTVDWMIHKTARQEATMGGLPVLAVYHTVPTSYITKWCL